jgi:hypothetical protein
MLEASLLECLGPNVVQYRRPDQLMRGSQIKSGQVPARNEICDVAGCDPKSVIDDSHDKTAGAYALALPTGPVCSQPHANPARVTVALPIGLARPDPPWRRAYVQRESVRNVLEQVIPVLLELGRLCALDANSRERR